MILWPIRQFIARVCLDKETMMKKDGKAPLLREQYKDHAIGVEKNLEADNELRRKELRIKEEELKANPKKPTK